MPLLTGHCQLIFSRPLDDAHHILKGPWPTADGRKRRQPQRLQSKVSGKPSFNFTLLQNPVSPPSRLTAFLVTEGSQAGRQSAHSPRRNLLPRDCSHYEDALPGSARHSNTEGRTEAWALHSCREPCPALPQHSINIVLIKSASSPRNKKLP
jgi:hypothetical protein